MVAIQLLLYCRPRKESLQPKRGKVLKIKLILLSFITFCERYAIRSKIKCLNGQLKSKFRTVLEKICVAAKNIIVAVAILHNIAKERNMSCNIWINWSQIYISLFFTFFSDLDASVSRLFSRQSHSIDSLNEEETGTAFRSGFIKRHF